MHVHHFARAALVAALACVLSSFSAPSRADPLITQGIGLQTCGKLATDLKPGQGSIIRPTI